MRVRQKLALYTGLRWGKIRSLQWQHVYWSPRPHLVVEKTKSGRVRRVPLNPEATDLLKTTRSGSQSMHIVPKSVKRSETIYRRAGRQCRFPWHF
ncbi:MAG: tyrosine-type recombinase/integrase, partial [Planctomycetota bacterium]